MSATLKQLLLAVVVAGCTFTAATAGAGWTIERRVDAYASKRYAYDAYSGEFVIVRLHGDGDTDLDLFVRDQHGRIVCQATGRSDRERCSFRDTNGGGRYSIEIRNLGDVYHEFELEVI